MTRTPTTSVTAIAIAARAFAWGESRDAHLAGIDFEMPVPRKSQSPQLP